MSGNNNISVEKNGWKAVSEISPPKMSFSLLGDELFKMSGVAIGCIQETAAICEKAKTHEYSSFEGGYFETLNMLPFGSEPEIYRKYHYAANHFKVTTDISFHSNFKSDILSIDTLHIKGVWSRVGVLTIKKEDAAAPPATCWNWMDISSLTKMEYKEPPLLWLFEKENGIRLEIGTGDDLWRWNISSRMGKDSSFILRNDKENGCLVIERRVISAPESVEVAMNNMRFSWYFSWEIHGWEFVKQESVESSEFSFKNNSSEIQTPTHNPCFHFNNSEWPESARVLVNGNYAKSACLHSALVQNRLKDLVRHTASRISGGNVLISGIEPFFCESASHMDRPQKKNLQHWNISSILDLWFWANRHLCNSGSKFFITSPEENSLFSLLPSLRGLSVFKF